MKQCSKCKQTQSKNNFYNRQASKDRLRSKCKSCCNKAHKLWVASNPDKVKEHRRRHNEKQRNDKEYGDKRRAASRAYYHKNPDPYKLRARQWEKEHPEACREKSQRRKAKKLSLPHDLAQEQWMETLEACNHKCVYCGADWEHQDHFVPLSKGGGYTVNNIVPSCSPCNLSKSYKDPFEFIKSLQQ